MSIEYSQIKAVSQVLFLREKEYRRLLITASKHKSIICMPIFNFDHMYKAARKG